MPRPTNVIVPDPDIVSPLRARHSLTEKHVAALSGLAWAWSLDRHQGYDGDLTSLLGPPEDTGSGFVISRKATLFHLAATTGDAYRQVGAFASLADLLRAVDPEQG